LKKLAALSACALALVVVLGAAAAPGGNGARQSNGHGKWFKRACDQPGGQNAACHADVVSDESGTPLASGSPPAGALTPGQFRSAYGLGNDSTDTIAIVDAYDDPTAEADLGVFSSQFGLPACTTANGCFRKVNQSGGTSYPSANSGWALEISLDIETAHGVCPGCKILLVEASSASTTNLGIAENRAVTLGAHVVSNSWSAGEFSGETSADTTYFKHPGVAITVSSGDSGYGVQWPAASPYVTAVGGTTLHLSGGGYGSETAWSDAGSGCSVYETKPAWQTDSGCSRRTVADVSADADPNTGAAVYDSTRYSGQSGWFQVGGTSLSSPLVAAVYALAGTASQVDYGQTPYLHTSSLHDVASGSNGSCGGSYLCTAVGGFDGPTGLGTPNGLAAFTAGSQQQNPDFSVALAPSSQSVTKGAQAIFTVTVGALNGFSGSVSLSSNYGSVTPGSVTTSGTATLSVDTSGLSPGTYTVTVTGSNNGTTHQASSTLVVNPAAQGDFSLGVSPSSKRIGRTSTTTYTVTVGSLNGFTGSVALTAAASPGTGITWSFSPVSVTGSGKSTLTVKASGLPRKTKITVTITGTSGSLTHTTTLSLST
jgi:subtilase family serine protease